MNLWARVCTIDALHDAWLDVRAAADPSDGKLPGGVRRYEKDLDRHLAHLHVALKEGWYRPQELAVNRIPKSDGTYRVLHVPPLSDRVVERALLNELTPLIDPTLSEAAHAYRPGRGVHTAVADVVALRESGFRWIARGDVDDCFPSISPDAVLAAMGPFGLPGPLLRVLTLLLDRRARLHRPGDALRGIPQGSPLSPLFMNLVLARFDEGLLLRGCPLVRYGTTS